MESLQAFYNDYLSQLLISLLIIAVYIVIGRIVSLWLEKGAGKGGFKESSTAKAIRIARSLLFLISVLVICLVWGVEFGSIFVFAGTTLTLLGVALFASWSILSNVTSYFVLLMHPSFRRGVFIRVIDADNYAEGYIADLSIFYVKLITESREIIVYPNNLILSRPALINPRDKLDVMGKLPATQSIEKKSEQKL